jgi:hypothetical protein
MLFAIVISAVLGGPAVAAPALVVQAPDSPVRIDRVRLLDAGDAPPVLVYAATNLTGDDLDTVTVMAFVFRDGVLKARQVAPARRALAPHETKYSTMVLDGYPLEPNDVVVLGVNQVQRTGSDSWWRADLQAAAESTVKRPRP